jgi:hypothetical protein
MRRRDTGDGDPCPHDPEHGRMIVTGSKRQWCPVQSHDMDGTPALYEYDGRTPVRRKGDPQ